MKSTRSWFMLIVASCGVAAFVAVMNIPFWPAVTLGALIGAATGWFSAEMDLNDDKRALKRPHND